MSEKLKMIPLAQLRVSKDNVRKTDRFAGVEDLARNIQEKGLLQNLVVHAVERGRQPLYEVDAGGRRLAALRLLAKRKKLPRDYRVRCIVKDGGSVATEISLAENFMRVPIHPADQFDAFAELAQEGLSVDETAARFGVTPTFVEQRLKLAAVSRRLIAEYRTGAMTLEQLMAFTLSDDHKMQEDIWFERSYADMPASMIRRLLTKAQVEGTDRRARFIGAAAYEAAGGVISRDLFDAEDQGYFTDSQLLDRLVAEQLTKLAQSVKEEGWQWVEVQADSDLITLSRYGRAETVEIALSETEEERLEELSERYDTLVESLEEESDNTQSDEIDDIAAEISTLQAKKESWPEEEKARAGAIIGLGQDGTLKIVRGLVKPNGSERIATNGGDDVRNKGRRRNGYSDSVLLDLSAHCTAALQELVAGQPEIALTALVHALTGQLFYQSSSDACLRIVASQVTPKKASESVGSSKAHQAIQAKHQSWTSRLPGKEQLWEWVSALDHAERLALLAHCIALTIDALDRPSNSVNEGSVSELAIAVGLDMRQWWQPTRENFLNRLTKNEILAAVSEGVSQQASSKLAGLKKDRMAREAERLLATGSWLPAPLRTLPDQMQQ